MRSARLLTWWLVVAGTVWTALVLWSLNIDLSRHRLGFEQNLLERGRALFTLTEMAREWNARHGGIYAPVTPASPPNPYLDVDRRDFAIDGVLYTMINPAYMTRQIADIARESQGVSINLTSLDPIRPANKADPWESAALRRFEDGTAEILERIEEGGGTIFRYMAPLTAKASCLACHAKQGYREGDVRGGISVTMPAAAAMALFEDQRDYIYRLHFVGWVAVSALLAFLYWWVLRHWASIDKIRGEQEILIADRTIDLRRANAELEHLAAIDPLTGAFNRRQFLATAEVERRRARRRKEPLALLSFDIDHFKEINDRHGHAAGDAVLRAVVHRAGAALRAGDILARFGGEEFVALLSNAEARAAALVAERLRHALAAEP
ncbi:MAG: diguanylate cyclase, partial [Alphaproteobacteria bacterium]|nr:diguanylate cyclase [Alphaproteobacteria bacterium]